eukprot:1192435-Prorocentrum_minimum.AAC.1
MLKRRRRGGVGEVIRLVVRSASLAPRIFSCSPNFFTLNSRLKRITKPLDAQGGDGSLSELGKQFAKNLALYMDTLPHKPSSVWVSSLKRTNETACHLRMKHVSWRLLDELYAGNCDGMTYQQVRPSAYHRAECVP